MQSDWAGFRFDQTLKDIIERALELSEHKTMAALAKHLGKSRAILYRMAEPGRESKTDPATAAKLAEAADLPLSIGLILNELAAMNPEDRAWAAEQLAIEFQNARSRTQQVHEVAVRVELPKATFAEWDHMTPAERRKAVYSHSRVVTYPGNLWIERPGMLYIAQVGNHMEAQPDELRRAGIPEGAVLEVKPYPPGQLPDSRDIVMVQRHENRAATTYEYLGGQTRSGAYETFLPFSPGEITRITHYRPETTDLPLEKERLILGKVMRIVHANVEQ